MSASCSSRVRFEVRITTGAARRAIVPISGIVTWKSESSSSRNASNSSSARSISSTSSTGGTSRRARSRRAAAAAAGTRAPKSSSRASAGVARLSVRMYEHLPRVVPLVERVRDVDPLVALQPDQARAEQSASVFATSVLPTPASPSSSSGLPAAAPRGARSPARDRRGSHARRRAARSSSIEAGLDSAHAPQHTTERALPNSPLERVPGGPARIP